LGDILGDQAEARAGLLGAVLHRGLTGKLVGELIRLRHFQGMLVSRVGQRGIPFERVQAGGSAVMICGVEESLRGGAGLGEEFGRERQNEECGRNDESGAMRNGRHKGSPVSIEHWFEV
jgi:hypothetical protein